ncbi:MAG: Chromosome (plasmid) partitioning protein ParA / Sporulation initiation inhibitor protein Soj [uncultured Thermomicrobiales bacterium]|uniref:Chromosome (Plasmid) partitioning protein ParA / Sporulation initiation inhibitor protein Soj n=1 Tax=uncultured Thermomicrobiales bacterium TaxID=1645740 RepID=A0A6J4VBK8_9BACT|nr:MAG: Chromosome (plasmid) partitioning protein ParA / Sporulation initiation inhibitor protein Soj [uncultured Thermomicrobiales bacterium]
MKTIVIANAKGGVAKTTTALHLAVGFADRGLDTIAIDMDPQGTLSQQLGVQATGEPTVREVLVDGLSPRDAFVAVRPNLRLLPANILLADADLALSQLHASDLRLRRALQGTRADIVVIDVPPSIGKLTVNALVAADGFIAPIDSEIYAMMGLQLLFRTVETVREYFNPGLRFLGPLLTMAEGRTIVTRVVEEELRAQYPETFTTVIRKSQRTKEAAMSGQTLYDLAGATAGADYRALVREVLARLGDLGEATAAAAIAQECR